MTTFSLVDSAWAEAGGAVSVSLASAPTAGNILFAVGAHRSDTPSASTFTVSDTEGGWSMIISHDQELTDSSARQAVGVWWKEATASSVDTIEFGADCDFGMYLEISPGTSYDWTFQEQSSGDSGTGSDGATGVSSGTTASVGASDLFVIGISSHRMQGSTNPSSVAFSNIANSPTNENGSSNDISFVFDFLASGGASGTKETTVTWSGSGLETTCCIAVFSDGAIGGGGLGIPIAYHHYRTMHSA